MSKYSMLLTILDHLSAEGRANGFTSKFPKGNTSDEENQARSRAYVHLYLKVKFGILDCRERENYVTDGSNDGGIDGYFVDRDRKIIYFLQSKFRANEYNFDNKRISLEEIAAMDITRISSGEHADAEGHEYNGKIKSLIRTISEIQDISRYKYQVVLIANIGDVKQSTLQKLTDNVPVDVFAAERCYNELVFPVVSGTYFNQEDLSILLDLSNKNAGTKISYEVTTEFGPCEITVLFVPTLEIAKTMFRYRNSILKYNPRSYLELDGGKVNNAIRETILSGTTNEFALLNNGITMLSDETNINEKIGQRNKAQLSVRNPQIINGGQTAFTLSRLFEENQQTISIFDNKEVLLKVITLIENEAEKAHATNKRELIDRISAATNSQTAVTVADRHSGENVFGELQTHLFRHYGILLERKRGEFEDGVRDGYVERGHILERNLFFRIFLASNGLLSEARKKKIFVKFKDPEKLLSEETELKRFQLGYRYYMYLQQPRVEYGYRKRQEIFGRIFAFTEKHFDSPLAESDVPIANYAGQFDLIWSKFVNDVAESEKLFISYFVDSNTGERRPTFAREKWMESSRIERDIRSYFTRTN